MEFWAVPCYFNPVPLHMNPLLRDCLSTLGCDHLKGGAYPIGLCRPGILCSAWEMFAKWMTEWVKARKKPWYFHSSNVLVLSAGDEEKGGEGQVTETHSLRCVGFGMGKPRFKGVNVTCPRWHNWVNFRYLCKSWILTLANLDDGGPTILSVIYPSSLQPGPGFIPVVSLLILDSWAQVLQIFPYSTSFLFSLFHDPPPPNPVLSSLNKFESHKGPNSSTTPTAFLGLLQWP